METRSPEREKDSADFFLFALPDFLTKFAAPRREELDNSHGKCTRIIVLWRGIEQLACTAKLSCGDLRNYLLILRDLRGVYPRKTVNAKASNFSKFLGKFRAGSIFSPNYFRNSLRKTHPSCFSRSERQVFRQPRFQRNGSTLTPLIPTNS